MRLRRGGCPQPLEQPRHGVRGARGAVVHSAAQALLLLPETFLFFSEKRGPSVSWPPARCGGFFTRTVPRVHASTCARSVLCHAARSRAGCGFATLER